MLIMFSDDCSLLYFFFIFAQNDLNLQNATEHSVCEQLLQQGIFNNDTLITVGFN